MKKLLFLLVTIFSLHTMYAQEKSNTCTEITFYKQSREDPNSKNSNPNTRSIHIQAAYAYIYNNVISIYFEEIPNAATISITNESNGEIVHSETYSSPTNLNIDINGENSGKYKIVIETENSFLEGNFSL